MLLILTQTGTVLRSTPRALTQEQEDRLLAFAGSDPVYRKYCDEIIILLGTGLRVSELCGLTTDLDFENRCIHVDHQLLRDSELGYYVDEPKTKKGVRQIPMSEKVYQALKRAVKLYMGYHIQKNEKTLYIGME